MLTLNCGLAYWSRMLPALVVCTSCISAQKLFPSDSLQAAKDAKVVETLLRLKGVNVGANPQLKATVLRYLETNKGTPKYLELIERFNIQDLNDELLNTALDAPSSSDGVNAMRLLLKFQDVERIQGAIQEEDVSQAAGAVEAVGLAGGKQSIALLKPLVTQSERNLAVRSAAVTALGRNLNGQRYLLKLVQERRLLKDLNFATANALLASTDQRIREVAAKHLTLPDSKNAKPLPPIASLAKQSGNAAQGHEVFKTNGMCNKCHKVRGEGKEVGPDLSEIGSKLSRDAMYVSILDPSAGISHNYESYVLQLDDGTVVSGIMISETDETVIIKTAEAIERKISKDEVEEMVKQKISLMPADLQKNLTVDDLVNVVEYLTTLKKPAS